MNTTPPVIAIDGPVGSGKGTISRILARTLGWHLLDSGALYRLVALRMIQEKVSVDDSSAMVGIATIMDISFANTAKEQKIFLDSVDVTLDLRTEECGSVASKIASRPALRAALLKRQRAFLRLPGLVADGRDIGSVVFPDALFKIFLTASPEERASRRYKQLKQKGINVSLPDVLQKITQRDKRDVNRKVAPLKAASDAQIFDSTGAAPEDTADKILDSLKILGIPSAN
jgi:cytidylate kinase